MDKRFRRKIVHEIDYDDFDELVMEQFPELRSDDGFDDFSIVAAEELSNDTAWTFTVSQSEIDELNSDPEKLASHQEELNRALAGDWKYCTKDLIRELARRGVIEPGDYVIEVSW